MKSRTLISVLSNDLQNVPAVVLFGPRQVGKTTLVKKLIKAQPEDFVYLDLELPSDRFKLSEPELFLKNLANRIYNRSSTRKTNRGFA